jgi:hypothetical protein
MIRDLTIMRTDKRIAALRTEFYGINYSRRWKPYCSLGNEKEKELARIADEISFLLNVRSHLAAKDYR